jgi:hypothetical protein
MPGVPVDNLECTYDDDGSLIVLLKPFKLPAALAAVASITCTFAVTATSTHAQNGPVPSFVVEAMLEATPADVSLAIESITVPPVPVSTGATLAVSGPVLQATSQPNCKHVSYEERACSAAAAVA